MNSVSIYSSRYLVRDYAQSDKQTVMIPQFAQSNNSNPQNDHFSNKVTSILRLT